MMVRGLPINLGACMLTSSNSVRFGYSETWTLMLSSKFGKNYISFILPNLTVSANIFGKYRTVWNGQETLNELSDRMVVALFDTMANRPVFYNWYLPLIFCRKLLPAMDQKGLRFKIETSAICSQIINHNVFKTWKMESTILFITKW